MMFYGNPEVVALEIVPAHGRFCGVRLWLAGVSVGEPELYERGGHCRRPGSLSQTGASAYTAGSVQRACSYMSRCRL